MNLHIFHETFFLDLLKKEFDNIVQDNVYIVINKKQLQDKFETDSSILFFDTKQTTDFINNNKISRIIIHYLSVDKIEAINQSNFNGEIHWCAWGGDLYNSIFNFKQENILEKETYFLVKYHKILNKRYIFDQPSSLLLKHILGIAFKLVRQKSHDYFILKKFIKKIDFCSTVLPYEYEYIKNNIPNIKYIPFSYGNLNTLVPKEFLTSQPPSLSDNILAGNSGTPTNNHIETFHELKNTNFQIFVPLTYGDKNYINLLTTKYKKSNIKFLTTHLEYEEYVDYLLSCNTFIVNHIRQHATGNIILALYLGMRVYINNKNKMYNFFKNLGVVVYSFQDDFKKYKNSYLSLKTIENNRKCLEKYWGRDIYIKRLKEFYEK